MAEQNTETIVAEEAAAVNNNLTPLEIKTKQIEELKNDVIKLTNQIAQLEKENTVKDILIGKLEGELKAKNGIIDAQSITTTQPDTPTEYMYSEEEALAQLVKSAMGGGK